MSEFFYCVRLKPSWNGDFWDRADGEPLVCCEAAGKLWPVTDEEDCREAVLELSSMRTSEACIEFTVCCFDNEPSWIQDAKGYQRSLAWSAIRLVKGLGLGHGAKFFVRMAPAGESKLLAEGGAR